MSDYYGLERRNAIRDIEASYPIDSGFGTTNAVGADLLIDAILEYGWRKLSTELLLIYAAKCRAQVNIEEAVK